MEHYADDVEFSSPTVVRRWSIPDGRLRGKDKLRANFEVGLKAAGPKFELVDVLPGVGAMCVVYRRETGAPATDLVEFDSSGLARRIVACYGQAGGS